MDFSYVDDEGAEHVWHFPGTGEYNLVDVLKALEIPGEIQSADLKLKEAVDEVNEAGLYLTHDEEAGEWWLHSDEAFDDVYLLTVVVDGNTYLITVKDDTYTEYTVARLSVKDYNNIAASLNWTPTNRHLWWVAMYVNGGQTYSASKHIDLSKPEDLEWKLSVLARDGNTNELNNGNPIQFPDPAGNDGVQIFLVSHNDQNNRPSNGNGLNENAIPLTGENSHYCG